MSQELIAIILAAIALAGVILPSLRAIRRDISEIRADISGIKADIASLRERMAHLEGILEGLRDVISGRNTYPGAVQTREQK